MAISSSSATASLAILIRDSSLRSHLLLEILMIDGAISEKGLLELTYYLDTACVVASKTMKTQPKALGRGRDALKAWLNDGGRALAPEISAALCGGLLVADSIWEKAPGPLLLDAVVTLRLRLEKSSSTG